MNRKLAAIAVFVIIAATVSGCAVRQETKEQVKLTGTSLSAVTEKSLTVAVTEESTTLSEPETIREAAEETDTETQTATREQTTRHNENLLEKITQIIADVTEKVTLEKTTREKTTVEPTKSMRVSGYSKQEIIDYFVLTALNDESGIDLGRVLKWTHRVGIVMMGNYVSRDVELVQALCETLNKISGFPGAYITQDISEAEVYMMFAGSAELSRTINGFGLLDNGYCGLVWEPSFALSKAVIGIDSGMINRGKRDSVICEELLQAMGLPNDSDAYWESVFRESSDLVEWPSNLDWGVVTVLYNTGIKPGMTEKQARETAGLFVKDGN